MLASLAFDLRDRAALYFPEVARVRFVLDPTAEEGLCGPLGASRQRGYFTLPGTIGLSPRLAVEAPERQAGVILHELGHAVEALSPGTLDHIIGPMGRAGEEARADIIGGFLSGQGFALLYDEDWIQTVGPGVARPPSLPR